MSASIHVCGFRAPDDKWNKMKAIWDACREAKVDPPKDVDRFFEGESPDGQGVLVKIEKTACCKEYQGDMKDGFEIEIAKLPKDITHIRFYNSY